MANDDKTWRPENTVHGWVATKYVDYGLPTVGLTRVEDGRRHGLEFFPRAFDTMGQCETRCEELNDEQS